MNITDHKAGFSLVEFMIAATVGLLLLSGMAQLFSSTKLSYRLQEDTAALEENARYAVDLLERSLRMADHWGGVPSTDVSKSVAGTACEDFAFVASGARPEGIRGYEGSTYASLDAGPKSCLTNTNDYQANTDILAVRFAAADSAYPYDSALSYSLDAMVTNTSVTPPQAYHCCSVTGFNSLPITGAFNAAYWLRTLNTHFVRAAVGQSAEVIRTNSSGQLSGITLADAGRYLTVNHQFNSHVYFVRPCSNPAGTNCATTDDDGQPYPTLNLLTWGSNPASPPATTDEDNGTLTLQPLVEGVEDLQILYGEDTDSPVDGVPNQYVAAASVGTWANVMSVQVTLTMRAQHRDLRYTSPAPYNDNYYRKTFNKIIKLRNRGA